MRLNCKKSVYHSLVVLLFFIPASFLCQNNIVPNQSFEEMESGHSNKPDGAGQVEFLKYWKNFETSDVYGPNYIPFYGASIPLSAKSGDKVLGFGPCEGAQVEFTQTIPEKSWVTVSFWYMPQNALNTEINVYLIADEVDGDFALDDCFNPEIEYETKYVAEVLGASENPPGEWHYFSETILVEGSEFNGLAVKGENIVGVLGDPNYVFIDDVSVEIFDFCSHLCTSGGQPKFNYIPDDLYGVVGNSGSNFLALVEGANEVEMIIWNRFGEEAFVFNSYDPNGLSDPGYNDFAIVWNGYSTLTGNDFICDSDAYPFRIRAKSCEGITIQHDGIINCIGIQNPPAIIYPETKVKTVDNCCEEYKFVQNYTYTSDKIESVDNFIAAGSNVTTAPYGNVVVQAGSSVEYRAGQQVIIETGFYTEPGAIWTSQIEPCGASSGKSLFLSNDYTFYDSIRRRARTQFKSEEEDVVIAPNPNKGSFHISYIPKDVSRVKIHDTKGFEVKAINSPVAEKKYQIRDIASGLYMVTFITSEGTRKFRSKMIVQ